MTDTAPKSPLLPSGPNAGRIRRHLLRAVLILFAVVIAVVFAIVWYANTATFQNRVRSAVISELEKSTGGHVQLQAFRWRLLHLEFEADNLTIHGLEAKGEIPYAHIDRLFVRLKIIAFFRTQLGLNYLEADHPVFHLIVYPDGSTNQPRPKHPVSSNKPVSDTVFDLAVNRTELHDGVAILNQQAIPFNVAANDLGATVTWSPQNDHYLGTIAAKDITAQHGRRPAVHSQLDLRLDAGRNAISLQSLRLQTGPSLLEASGSLTNFADPQWQLVARGKIDVREVADLTEIPGLGRGIAELQIGGHGNKATWSLDGNGKVTDASYLTEDVHVARASGEAAIHLTPEELLLTRMRGRLAEGGTVQGELHLLNLTSSTRQQGSIRVTIAGITLDSLMAVVAPRQYRDLGFDTAATGAASVEWKGNPNSFVVTAKVSAAPLHPQNERGETPLSGAVDATYRQGSGTVEMRDVTVQTPASHLSVTGVLGVYPLTRTSAARVELTTENLAEFDKTLTALGLSANGKKGVEVIPARLHGQAHFQGTFAGSLMAPEIAGLVHATDFDAVFQPLPATATSSPAGGTPGEKTSISTHTAQATQTAAPVHYLHFDQLTADGEYSPDLISIKTATFIRGTSKIQASGQLTAHRFSAKVSAWDKDSRLNAEVQVQNADAAELLRMTGQDFPVTGKINLEAHAGGELGDLNGGGHLAVTGGAIYGESYKSLNTDLRFAGTDIDAEHLIFLQDGGSIHGSAGYDFDANSFHFTAQGGGFDLAHIQHLKNAKYPVSGVLAFEAHGSGTPEAPVFESKIHLTGIHLADVATGFIDADAHTQGHALLLNLNAHLNSAVIQVTGQTQLSGDYDTQAKLTLAQLDIDPILRTFSVSHITGHSSIGATVNVHGPLRTPRKLNGDALISQFTVALEGVPLQSDGSLHATLTNGMLHLDPVHITGTDTDLHAQGSLGVFDESHALNGSASGSINMTLIETLDTDLISSGHVDFNVDAAGTIADPDLTGQVKFSNVNAALDGFTNGLSRMNGTLVFDQDRLDFKDVTAYSGGGLIRIGGFLTYKQGLYGDLTATAHDVRIRYPQGVTSVADTKLRFQGTQNNMQLSGTVTITRFSISQDIDLAGLSSATGGISLPPNPDAPTNRVRLDIHVTSAPSLDFQNSYAKLAGDVDLRVRGTIAQPSVLGRITVTEGSATFAGTKYELQHGDIYFSNPIRIDPVIDLDATAHVEDYDITIGVHGSASRPSPTFRSEPPLSEQDIFSLLAMGRTQEEQQIYSSEQEAAGVNSTADALLGGALNATVSSRIQRLFGGGSVKIDPTFVSGSGNATARITVEQQVSKNATLTYATNVNSTAQQLIQGELNITKDLSVLAVRDESGVFSLIFRLHRRYR
jgi:translocation and assembly module TamB